MTFFAMVGLTDVAIPVILGLLTLSLIWRAWWLYPAWAWFIVPLGMPQITFWHFTALMFMVGILTHKIDTKEDNRKEQWAAYPIVFIWPILVWFMLRWMASV